MKRILLMVLKNLIHLPKMALQLFRYAGNVDKYTEQERYDFLRGICYKANKGGAVDIQCTGLENIPKENGFMMFPNHQGMYDVLAILTVCDKPLSVVSKKEVKNVPFLNKVFQCLDAQFMDREDVRQSMQVIMEVSKQVKKGRNYIIFPEGTRSKRGNCVGEFKAGSFKAATKAKCPIVPVALIDAFKPFDFDSIAPATVQVHILEPLLYEEYKDMKTVEIAQEVRDRIIKKIQKSVDN